MEQAQNGTLHSRESAPLGIGDILRIGWRRRYVFIAVGVAVAAALFLNQSRTVPLYEARATMVIDRGRKAVQLQGEGGYTAYEYVAVVNTERERILSRRVLARAMQDPALLEAPLYADLPHPEDALRGRIGVQSIPDSWAMTITLRDESPARAEQGLAAVVDAYLAVDLEDQRVRAKRALEFLQTQVADAQQQLLEGRRKEEAYRKEHNILANDPDENHIALRLKVLNEKRADMDAELASAQVLAEQLHGAKRGRDTAAAMEDLLRIDVVSRDLHVREQLRDLYRLREQRVVLAQKYLDKHPRMIESAEQIATKTQQTVAAIGMVVASAENHLLQLQRRHQELVERIQSTEEELTAYRGHLIALEALREQIRTSEATLSRLRTRLQEEEIASRLENQQVIVVDRPRAGGGPVNIRRSLWIVTSLFGGLVAGALAGLALEFTDRRLRRVTDIQALCNLPVLTQIPQTGKLLEDVDPQAAPPPVAEAIRQLRAALSLIHGAHGGCRIIAVSSPAPGDGKTTVAVQLAASLAASGNRTLLLDADLRHPSVAERLGISAERGLAQALAGDGDAMPYQTRIELLDALPVGAAPENPADLMDARRLGPFLDALRSRYDAIVIDSPPLGIVADALTVAELADGTILVVREGRTPKGLLREALHWLAPLAERVLGIVYNGERGRVGGGGGAYYYYPKQGVGATTRFKPGVISGARKRSVITAESEATPATGHPTQER